MIYKPQHTCFKPCAGCVYELGQQDAKRKLGQSAKYVWMVEGSDNPCDIRRYSFSHQEGIDQLGHRRNKGQFADVNSDGKWRLFKLVPVNRMKIKKT